MVKKILVSLCMVAAILVGVSVDGTTLPAAQAGYAQYYSVGNRAMPLALQAAGIRGGFNSFSMSRDFEIGYNGTYAQAGTVDAWLGWDSIILSSNPLGNSDKNLQQDRLQATTRESEGSGKAVNLSDELAKSGVKYNPNDVVAITKTADGKLVWLENGNKQAGLEHIMNHADDFAAKGIARGEIKDLVMTALEKGEIVGYQGKGTGRPIYEVVFKGEKQRVAITVGNNGFVVGANPQSLP